MHKPLLYLGNLDGPEGNVFVILGRAAKVAKENGMDWEAISAEAKSGDYQHVLDTMRKHFDAQVMDSIRTRSL